MVIIIKQGYEPKKLEELTGWIEDKGLKVHLSAGENTTIMGLIGDTTALDADSIRRLEIVEAVKRISEPYKKANRKFHVDDTVVRAGGKKIGGGHFAVIAGPCSVETPEQVVSISESIKKSGANFLRGGAYKPRTSPYAFQGLQQGGIDLLRAGKEKFGLPIVTEIMDISDLAYFSNDLHGRQGVVVHYICSLL